MQSNNFDELIRRLSIRASRRSIAAGVLAAPVLGILGTDGEADAKKGNNGKGKGGGNGKGKGNGNGDKKTICHCPGGDPAKCRTLRVGKKAAQAHLREHCDYEGECRDDVVNPCEPQSKCFPVIDTEGDVDQESGGRFEATTEGNDAFGNLIFGVPEGTTFGDLGSIESSFDFSTGTCTAGTPRFVVFLENGRCPYAAFPPGGDCSDGEGTTGNLVGNNTPFVWNDDLCGGSGLGTNTYDEVLALYENVEIDRIVLVVDESGGEQTVVLDPCISLAGDETG
ncbi:MAG: hypothetical protein U0031_23835 [Thermomicrobiales bacterium]